MLYEEIPLLLTLGVLGLAMLATEMWRIAADEEALVVCRTDDTLLAAIATHDGRRAGQTAPTATASGLRIRH